MRVCVLCVTFETFANRTETKVAGCLFQTDTIRGIDIQILKVESDWRQAGVLQASSV